MHRQSETRAGNHRRHTRTRNASLPTQANLTAQGARKQPPNQGAIHAASEVTTPKRGMLVRARGPAVTIDRGAKQTWAGVSCVCVPLMVSCSGFGLPLHAQLLRLFVTKRGPALRLGVCLLGFPAVACAVTPMPTIASLVTKSKIVRIGVPHICGVAPVPLECAPYLFAISR